jgi:putative ABC transport system permease protein
MIEALLQDLRYALRTFRVNPGFTITAVAALALGIGANTAIFSVVNTVLLKPLAYPDPDRIVQFMLIRSGATWVGASPVKFNLWREQTSNVLQDVSAYRLGLVNLTGGPYPEQVPMAQVSADTFRLFGAPLEQGRSFTAEEDQPGGPHVSVISHGLWQRRFGGDSAAIGKTISLGGEPYVVIGVLAPGFDFDSDPPPDIWTPFQLDPNSADQAHYFSAAARLKPGVTIAMANAQLQLAAERFHRQYPSGLGTRDGFAVRSLMESFVSDVRPSLLILTGAVGLVLLIACANVAGLLLIRASGRKREIAVRAALGAGRSRIVRQLLTESILLSTAAGTLGLLLGIWGVRALLVLNPGDIPRIGVRGAALTVDWRVASFMVLASLATGILCGLMPALQASRGDLNTPLKESGRSGTGLRQNRARSVLVIGETALALVLLIGSALLIRSFVALRSVDRGFETHNVLTLHMSLTSTRFDNTSAVGQLVREATQRIDALPGVIASGATSAVPLEIKSGLPFDIIGRPLAQGPVRVGWTTVSPGYFDVFRIPIHRGRGFTERDDHAAPGVAIINQTMARTFWPGRDPVGDRIIIGKGYGPGFDEPAREIVGISADIRDEGLGSAPSPTIYVPIAQVADGITALFARVMPIAWTVRTRVAPQTLRSAVETELRQASGGLPVAGVESMDQVTAHSTARSDFNTLLMNIFASAALLLAAIGLYGLMAYSVEQRTPEMGIRQAMGAGSSRVRNMVVLEGMRLALIGIFIGSVGAFILARLMTGFLFGVTPWDPIVYATVPAVVSLVALLAVWIPARRAARIDPAEALRHS